MIHRSARGLRPLTGFAVRSFLSLGFGLWGCGSSSDSGPLPPAPPPSPTSITVYLGNAPLAKTLHDMSHPKSMELHPRFEEHLWFSSLTFDDVTVRFYDEELLRVGRAWVNIGALFSLKPDDPCNLIQKLDVSPERSTLWSAEEARVFYERVRTGLDHLNARMLVSKSLTGEGGRNFAIRLLREDRRARTDNEFWRDCAAVENFFMIAFRTESGLLATLDFSCAQDATSDGVSHPGVRLKRATFGFQLGKSVCYGPGGVGDPDVWSPVILWQLDHESPVNDSEIKEAQDKAGQP